MARPPMSQTRSAASKSSVSPPRNNVSKAAQRPGGYTPRDVARPKDSRPVGPQPVSPVVRLRWVNAIVAIVVCVFVLRLVQLQVINAGPLAAEAQAARIATFPRASHRGQITDRNGVVLATSVDTYTIAADPRAIQGFKGAGKLDANGEPLGNAAVGISQLLSPLLNTDPMELAARINGNNRYVVIARDVSPEVQREIVALGLQAYVSSELKSKRIYPSGALAGTLLGFVDVDQIGQGGIERAYNDVLAGSPGIRSYERGRDGVPIPGGVIEDVPAVDGGDVILTIDRDLQWKAQEMADAAVERFGAEHAVILVQEIATGEFWAIADSGRVDPNDRTDARVADGSRAVQDTFEPGSTGKIITMAAALETGVVTPFTEFTVPFRYQTPNGQSFRDAIEHPTQYLTATGVLAKSSNTGTVQISENIPRATLYDYFQKFRLGQRTGLDLPGESRGVVHPYEKWDGRTKYAVAFGQGLTVNAVQATGVYSTVANNGVFVAPTIVHGTRAPHSNNVTTAALPETSQVIAPETASILMNMLEQAASDDGTARAARIDGYRIAGKTGTAELIWEDRTTIMASFIGVAPADNPKFTVSVFVNGPQWGTFGGTVAAPWFKEVMGFVLQQQNTAPSVPETNPLPVYWGADAAK